MRPTDGRIHLLGRDVTRLPRAPSGPARARPDVPGLEPVPGTHRARERPTRQPGARHGALALLVPISAATTGPAPPRRGAGARRPRKPGRPTGSPTSRTASSASSRSRWRSATEPRAAAARRAGGRARVRRAGPAPPAPREPAADAAAPAHRARHVTGARSRRPGAVHAQRPRHRPGHAGRGAAATRRFRRSTSAERLPMLDVVGLEAGYASARVLNGVIAHAWAKARSSRCSGATAWARPRCCDRSAASGRPSPAAGTVRFRATGPAQLQAHEVARQGSASCRRAGACSRRLTVEENLRIAARPPSGRMGRGARSTSCSRGSAERARSARGHAVRWRAADARDRPGADDQPGAARHGRAVGGTRARGGGPGG